MDTLLLKPEEAARVLGISRAKLYQLLSAGRLPSICLDSSRRIPAAALRRWVDNQVQEQQSDVAD